MLQLSLRKIRLIRLARLGRFPDHLKASDDLQAFGKMHESRLYKFITTCLDVSVDLKTLVKSMVQHSTSERHHDLIRSLCS